MHRLLMRILRKKNSLLVRTSCARRNIEFGQLTGKKRVFRKFRGEFLQLYAGQFYLFFAQGLQRQQNLGKRSQIAAMICGDLKLPDSRYLVAVDSGEADRAPGRLSFGDKDL